MTLIISTISLGVVVPTLKEAHLMKTAIGQIILLVAVIADLVTMIFLAVFASTSRGWWKHLVTSDPICFRCSPLLLVKSI